MTVFKKNDLIKIKSNTNYIASITTKFHLLGLIVYIKKNQENNKNYSGTILVNKHVKTGFSLKKKDFNLPEFNDSIIIFDEGETTIKKIIRYFIVLRYLKKKNYDSDGIDVISVRRINLRILDKAFKSHKKIRYLVFLDEGASNNYNLKTWLLTLKNDNSFFAYLVKATNLVCSTIINYILVCFLTNKQKIINRSLICNFKGSDKVNIDVVNEYKDHLIIHENMIASSLKKQKYILFITQPFFSEIPFNNDDVKNVLRYILNKYKTSNSCFLLKIHPRDSNDYSKYEIFSSMKIYSENISLENMANKIDISKVIGYSSTSLYTLKLFYGVDSISFGLLVDKFVKDKLVRAHFKEFHRNYKDLVSFPKVINEG